MTRRRRSEEVSLATLEATTMATVKCLKKGEVESRREDDETRQELAPEVAMTTTQGEEGGPNKKTWPPRKEVPAPSKTVSQICEELNLDPVATQLNVEQGVVNQAVTAKDQSNVPLEENEEIESEESEKKFGLGRTLTKRYAHDEIQKWISRHASYYRFFLATKSNVDGNCATTGKMLVVGWIQTNVYEKYS